MDNILFRNSLIKEIKNFNTSSFFKLQEVPNNGYVKDIDTRIHETLEGLNNVEVNSITIPISITENFLEFSGLRLAHHIRLTPNLSFRKTPIIIMGSLNEKQLLKLSSLANILLTPNVFYVNLSKYAFDTIEKSVKNLELSDGLSFDFNKYLDKVTINPPTNYEDSHSIANEWAIYRWAKTINASDESINRIEKNIENNLYFKYLQTIYPISKSTIINADKLQINYSGKPKILYIDDEAEKGWEEIFSYILGDINDLHFEILDINYKETTQENLIEGTLVKIKEEDIDLVILDFRLLPQDFQVNDISEVSGLKILKAIKKINPGIQVIIFSATNKVWNLEALQLAGSDSFILKELPENSIDKNLSSKLINSFLINIQTGLKRKFLKEAFLKLEIISSNLDASEYEDDTDYSLFIMHLKSQIKLVINATKKVTLLDSSTIDIVFLNCYNFLELFKDYYLRESNYNFILGIEQIEMNRYRFSQGTALNQGQFIRNNRNDNPSWFQTLASILIDYFFVCEIDDRAIFNLNKIKNKRNDYIHGKKKSFDQNELLLIIDLLIKITKEMKE